MLRVCFVPRDQIDEGASLGTDAFGSFPDLGWGSAFIGLMSFRHLFGDGRVLAVAGRAYMGGNPQPLMENLDRAGSHAGPDLLA